MKIFVGNLPSDCARADIIDLFEKYGSVKDCDIIKNYAFVQMDDEDDAKDAIESLSKSKFMGNDLTVEESTSRPRNTQKLYVGNLSSATSRRDLEKMFDKYGDVTSCDIIKDYAFVHMAKERDAEKAIRDLHGVTVDGRKLIVDFSRSESERRGLGRYGSGGGRGYRDYNDRYNDYSYNRGGYGGGYHRGGGGYYNNYRGYNGGGGGRYNSYNRDRSPVRRRRVTRSRSRSRSPSKSPSRSPSRSPERQKSESRSPKRRRKRTHSRHSPSKSPSRSPDRRSTSSKSK
ncbi:RNA-binding protein 4-like isoform X1 [Styela clava]